MNVVVAYILQVTACGLYTPVSARNTSPPFILTIVPRLCLRVYSVLYLVCVRHVLGFHVVLNSLRGVFIRVEPAVAASVVKT
jgi:hypothetical protein